MTIKAHNFFCCIILIFVLLTNEKQNLKQIILLLLYNGKSISASSDFVLRRMIGALEIKIATQTTRKSLVLPNELVNMSNLLNISVAFLGTIGCGAVLSKYVIFKIFIRNIKIFELNTV